MIRLKNIEKVYRGKEVETQVLRDFNMTVQKGEFVCICGRSGCGKTTLLNILGLLDKSTGGSYELEEIDVNTLRRGELAKLRNRKFGFVFQAYNLIAELNVLENICIPLGYAGVGKKKRETIAEELLDRFGLKGMGRKYPAQLSGGEQQRVAIARAISNNPAIILADEPTGNLDHKNAEIAMDILKSLHQQGHTIIMVTHDESLKSYGTRVIQMEDGKIGSL